MGNIPDNFLGVEGGAQLSGKAPGSKPEKGKLGSYKVSQVRSEQDTKSLITKYLGSQGSEPSLAAGKDLSAQNIYKVLEKRGNISKIDKAVLIGSKLFGNKAKQTQYERIVGKELDKIRIDKFKVFLIENLKINNFDLDSTNIENEVEEVFQKIGYSPDQPFKSPEDVRSFIKEEGLAPTLHQLEGQVKSFIEQRIDFKDLVSTELGIENVVLDSNGIEGVLKAIGYSSDHPLKKPEDVHFLIKEEGLAPTLHLLELQIRGFIEQRDALSNVFDLTDALSLEGKGQLVVEQEKFRAQIISDSGKTKSEVIEVESKDGATIHKFLFERFPENNQLLLRKVVDNPEAGTFKEYFLSADVNPAEKRAFLRIKPRDSEGNAGTLDELKKEVHNHELLAEKKIPNIAELFFHNADVEGVEERYIVTENFESNASDYARGREELSPEVHEQNMLKIGKGIAENLVRAQDCGIVFRDIKPDNIMINTNENGEVEKVAAIDHGLVTTFEHVNNKQEIAGTPGYCPPEVLKYGRSPPQGMKNDIYSLGSSLAEIRYGDYLIPNEQSLDVAYLLDLKNIKDSYSQLSGKKVEDFDDTDKLFLAMMDPSPARRPSTKAVLNFLEGRIEDPKFKKKT